MALALKSATGWTPTPTKIERKNISEIQEYKIEGGFTDFMITQLNPNNKSRKFRFLSLCSI
jgi:hypothetical protein